MVTPHRTVPNAVIRRLFDTAAVEEIESAVAEAERRSSTEVVVYLVAESAEYPEAQWKGTALGALAGMALSTLLRWIGPWGGPTLLQVVGLTLIGACIGWLLVTLSPTLRRVAVEERRLQMAAERRAALAFLDEGVYETRDGTGLLILVALFERRCVVLPDRAVREHVEQSEWEEMAQQIADGVRAGAPAPAVVQVIQRFGTLLDERGLARRADDRDELSDQVRIEES